MKVYRDPPGRQCGEPLELVGECSIAPPFGRLPTIVKSIGRDDPAPRAPSLNAPPVASKTVTMHEWKVDLCSAMEARADGNHLRVFPAIRLRPEDDPTNLPGWRPC